MSDPVKVLDGDEFQLVAELLRTASLARPLAPAIVAGDRQVSYAEFRGLVASVSHRMAGAGVVPGDRVAVLCDRSPEVIAAFVACLSMGVCYVPIDVAQPASRIREIVGRSAARVLLGTPENWMDAGAPALSLVGAEGADTWEVADFPASSAGYMIFTSGSTGRPKGVLISQANLASYVPRAIDMYAIRQDDRVLQVASLGFDWSVSEILPTLAAGAALVLRSSETLTSAAHLAEEVERHGVTVVHLPTAVWHAIVPDLAEGSVDLPASVRHVTIGAESASLAATRAWVSRFGDRVRLVNTYGPTECTVEATYVDLAGPGSIDVFSRAVVPIGRPIPGCHVYVLDDHLAPVRQGASGRIFIGGRGVGQGYFRDPEETARRFVLDPFQSSGSTMYDTGDVGRWNEFGELEFVGRKDNQVKISGFRVEIEEIEFNIAAHEAVKEVSVVADRATSTLSAFVVPRWNIGTGELRSWLGGRVPVHMVPTRFMFVEALPRTVNDKVDRTALERLLPDSEPSLPVEPATDVESRITEIWMKVLRLTSVDVTEDFFELGGHSLLAMRLVGQMSKQLGSRVELNDLFQARTIRGLANLIRERVGVREK
ncbi:non-ribosomal peptide synthetase [Actinophytocola sp.]|uniref:non-ribosomal peptide synthetase n=1 Tax=Actinophytocola sp. TaxID=1872138 RepID=UPI002D70B819|nr:non-ribosomal peptide synthetase [Actinophytocola sp.]HYQ69892.1 non-ribosomal peptide synthetase [Actinophytocola sp.]